MQERHEQTNIIKIRFIQYGRPAGREYAYYTPQPVQVGDTVEIPVNRQDQTAIATGVVTQVNVPEAVIAPFKDRAKTIIGKAPAKEGDALCEA